MQEASGLQAFTRDIVPILQLAVGALGLVSLVFLILQLKQTNKWNRINSSQNFVNPKQLIDLERAVYNALITVGIDVQTLNRSLNDEELKKVIADDEAFYSVKAYLNDLENLGVAVNEGVTDSNLAFRIHSSRVFRAHKIFQPYIEHIQKSQNDDKIYCEIETMVSTWKERELNQQINLLIEIDPKKLQKSQ